MRNIKICLSFDGSKFSGWQRQKNKRTVQQEIEEIIEKITGEKVKITGCGRTDSGVHAINYIANFKTKSKIPCKNLKNAINSYLVPEVIIKEAREVNLDFHSRYDAKRKTYLYLISLSKTPFLINYAYFYKGKIDIEKMIEATQYLIGKHDFSSFAASGSSVKNTVREIFKIEIKKDTFFLDRTVKLLKIEIEANGFLYKMARNIVGTLIYVGAEKIRPYSIKDILEAKNRKLAGPTAPSCGLYLKRVKYR